METEKWENKKKSKNINKTQKSLNQRKKQHKATNISGRRLGYTHGECQTQNEAKTEKTKNTKKKYREQRGKGKGLTGWKGNMNKKKNQKKKKEKEKSMQ